jgi:hypothetical protein
MVLFDRRTAALWTAVAAVALAQSCASLGPRGAEAPCDERFDEIVRFPAVPGEALEIVGKLRIDLSRYRIRGLARIVYVPVENTARIDFRHSSLFGAVEEDVTLLIGDSLVIEDRTGGRYIGNDSSLALVKQETGCDVAPDDILAALLFELPRCAEMESAAVVREGDDWRLRGDWRGRRLELRGNAGDGIVEFKECYAGHAGCYTVTYGERTTESALSYPRWIRLRREGAQERITFDLVDIKVITVTPGMFETEEAWAR